MNGEGAPKGALKTPPRQRFDPYEGYQAAAAAHDYIDRGFAVVILKPREKVPNPAFMSHGLHDATENHDVIKRCFVAEPESNLGLRTGAPWFDVLDFDGDPLDPEHALNKAMPLAERAEDDPVVKGPTVVTGKGAQAWVAPTGLGNRAAILPCFDWRGRNGYVVVPPSIHPNGKPYYWKRPDDPVYGPLAPIVPAPSWVLALLERPAPSATCVPIDKARPGSKYGRRALEGECGRIAIAAVGQRNDALNRGAFAVGTIVGAGALDVDEAIAALLTAALRGGLEEREARATIASGLKSGAAQPRVLA